MNPDEEARKVRAEARGARMVIRRGHLREPEVDFTPVAGADAISLLTRLTIESFSLAGAGRPAYSRKEIPVAFVLERTDD